jgi:magnesium transporter
MPSEVELDTVRDAFAIPKLAVDDARRKHDRPKVERHSDCLLVVAPTARDDDGREAVDFGDLPLRRRGLPAVGPLRQSGPVGRRSLRDGGQAGCAPVRPGAVLQAAMLHVVRWYAPVIEGLEHDERGVERDVFSERRAQPAKRIFFLIRQVLDFLMALERCRHRSSDSRHMVLCWVLYRRFKHADWL